MSKSWSKLIPQTKEIVKDKHEASKTILQQEFNLAIIPFIEFS
jgi:hypothetical protein